ncbi:histidine kinase [Streptomyces sp. NPDC020875]|uniref:sensor histidine kinase n=1 Tax=Streptomyces sp. NPDC020875 TaxID=3154898 RepID=UPI0033E958D9
METAEAPPPPTPGRPGRDGPPGPRGGPLRPGVWLLNVVGRDPLAAPGLRRNDAVLAAVTGVVAVVLAAVCQDGGRPDALGWLLLAGAVVPLAWRRVRPFPAMLTGIASVAPYHAMDNAHVAPMPASLILLYTVASLSRPRTTALVGGGVLVFAVGVMFTVGPHQGLEALRTSGWVIAVLFCGTDVRAYRRYIASVIARAEHAERTREQEAARRVAEERVRIARDLHDLLAHSITLIGVQTSVASHVLTVDPDRLDRAALAKALDDIADTCRTARGELRTTLTVLRTDPPGGGAPDGPEAPGTPPGPGPGPDGGPLPDLAALPGLAAASGAALTLRPGDTRPPSAVAAAAYRIVQESLTNAVRHGGTGVRAHVTVEHHDGALHVTVTDDGDGAPHDPAAPAAPPGFGIAGMRERARSVHGTLTAGPRPGGGFRVAARLPLQPAERPE